jgi:hypothetical protein
VKRSKPGAYGEMFLAKSTTPWFTFGFITTDNFGLEWTAGVAGAKYRSVEVFRDFSAWYHIVVAFDTTQATDSDRVKVWVNNSLISNTGAGGGGWPSLNTDYQVNDTIFHGIGGNVDLSDQYLADIHFIDSQALTPSAFGEFDTNGVWQPIEYTGTFGTTGFHLPFSDNSTAAALGTDSSGAGNTWTVNNIAVGGTGNYLSGFSGDAAWSGGPRKNAFDGNLSTFWQVDQPSSNVLYSSTWTAASSIPFTTLRVYVFPEYGYGVGAYWKINGVTMPNQTGSAGWYTPTGVGSSLSTIELTAKNNGSTYEYGRLYAIEINGVILVDSSIVGPANDSLVDSPTNYGTDTGVGGSVRGNYCTWNPLFSSSFTYTNGNLDIISANSNAHATIGVGTGKWYWEATPTTVGSTNDSLRIGVRTASGSYTGYVRNRSADLQYGTQAGDGGTADSVVWQANTVYGLSLDCDNNELKVYKTNSLIATVAIQSGQTWFPWLGAEGTSATWVFNWGQRPFAYTAPSGFKALCTTNLPEPTIADGSTVMDVALYTGNGSTQTISGLNFSPDLVWIKARSTSSYNHFLLDTVRGVNNELNSNTTDFEYTRPAPGSLTAFNSDGFDLNTAIGVNASSTTYAAWTWDAGSSTVTNTQGSISSQVRANASAGFSVVTYTSSSSVSTVGHGLGVAPYLIITKNRSVSNTWWTYHNAIGNTKAMRLDTTDAQTTISSTWNNTSPTSTVFTVGGEWGNGNNIVAYCFAPVAGYSSFGSYTGNGATGWPNADGPFVFLGFRPKFILWKCTSQAENWVIYDSVRETYNFVNDKLLPNSSAAESTNNNHEIDFLSNGFKIRNNNGEFNQNAATYIYAAFAENPFQYARAR